MSSTLSLEFLDSILYISCLFVQILSSDHQEPKKKLRNIVMAATRWASPSAFEYLYGMDENIKC